MSAKSFREQLGELIQKAEAELDELQLNIALGKMTGADLFEDIKRELRESFREIKSDLHNPGNENEFTQLVNSLYSLAQSGKAEAAEAFEEQKLKITNVISQLEKLVQGAGGPLSNETIIKIRNEIDKFRLKMEILHIRYELGRLDRREKIETGKVKFHKNFNHLLTNLSEDLSGNAEEDGNRLKNAYEKLRKLVQN